MRELVLELMGEYGNLAVFLLILVENLFPPIPSEVILTFGGVMTVCTDMTPVGVILFSTAGSLAGAVILYSVGRFLPDEVFRKLLCSWLYRHFTDGRSTHIRSFHHQILGSCIWESADNASIISCRTHLGPLLFW